MSVSWSCIFFSSPWWILRVSCWLCSAFCVVCSTFFWSWTAFSFAFVSSSCIWSNCLKDQIKEHYFLLTAWQAERWKTLNYAEVLYSVQVFRKRFNYLTYREYSAKLNIHKWDWALARVQTNTADSYFAPRGFVKVKNNYFTYNFYLKQNTFSFARQKCDASLLYIQINQPYQVIK